MTVQDVPIALQNEIIRGYQLKLAAAGGRACMSRTKRSLLGKMKAASNWRLELTRFDGHLGEAGRMVVV